MKIIFLYILITANIYSQTGTLKGKVTHESIPISSASIYIIDQAAGTVSDKSGNYIIYNIPLGKHCIRFSCVGFKSKIIEYEITGGKHIVLDIELEEKVVEVDPIEIFGDKKQEQDDPRTSVINLNPRNAKILPGAGEDVLRTLQSLPGVVAPNDFSSQLIIRGSGPDQNLIIMDDIEVFNPYRLYGVISMFNPDAVSNVNLITGGFPAKYGDRLSAVLDVTNREGNKQKNFSGMLNASIIDANIVLEGKNPFNIDGSWLINSRRTYYDLIIEPFVKNTGLVEDDVTFPNFYDFQAKLVFGPFKGHKIILNGIYSRDGVDVVSAKDRKTPDSIDVYNITKNDVLGISWHYVPSTEILNKLIFSWYRNSADADLNSKVLDPSLNREDFKEIIPDTLSAYLLAFKFNTVYSLQKYSIDDKLTFLWNDHVFEAGAGVDLMKSKIEINLELDPQLASFLIENPIFTAVPSDIAKIKNYNRYRAYIQNIFKITEDLNIQPSIRFDYYNNLKKQYLAPRLFLSYAVDELTTIRAMAGLYFQSPGYEKIVDQTSLIDLNEIYTKQLNAERAIHYVAGIERWITNEWNVKLEAYYKDFNNLIIQKKVKGTKFYTEPIPGKDPRYSDGWTRPIIIAGDSLTQIPVNDANGEAYGVELFLSKKNLSKDSKLSGWISYTLAFADRFERGIKYPFRFDQRHTINFVLNYKINYWLDAGLRWQYGSGFPLSEPAGVKPRIILTDSDLNGVPDTPELVTRKNTEGKREVIYNVDFNNQRLNSQKPVYHRLDIRFTAFTRFWGLDWTFYLDVINAYNRSNVIGYDYYIAEDLSLGREANTMFPIIPTIGLSFRF